MFKWARQPHRGHMDHNPFGDLEAPARKPKPRERTLSLHELAQVRRALDEPWTLGIAPAGALALRLIFATAARPGMVAGMVRGELIGLDNVQPKPRALRLVGSKIETGPVWDGRADEEKPPLHLPALAAGGRHHPRQRCGR